MSVSPLVLDVPAIRRGLKELHTTRAEPVIQPQPVPLGVTLVDTIGIVTFDQTDHSPAEKQPTHPPIDISIV